MSLISRVRKFIDRIVGPSPDRKLPYSTSTAAPGVSVWRDIPDEFGYDAWRVITDCSAVQMAMNKRAAMLADYQIEIVSDDTELAERLNERYVKPMRGTSDMLKFLAWSIIYGWRANRITPLYLGDVITCDFRDGGRDREKVNYGRLVWDGTSLFLGEDFTGTSTEGYVRTSGRLDRGNYVLWKPGNTDVPTGDLTLARALYPLADEYNDLLKQSRLFGQRYALPFTHAHYELSKIDPDSYAARRGSAQNALMNAMHTGGVVDDPLFKAVQFGAVPSGSHNFILERLQKLRDEAHEAILNQSLTTNTSSAGPTGSSQVAERAEARAVEQDAESLSDALDRDVGGYLRRFNRVDPDVQRGDWRVVLSTPIQPREVTTADVVSALNTGLSVDYQQANEAFGGILAPPADGSTVLKPVTPSAPANPFGGLGLSYQPCPVHGPAKTVVLAADDPDEENAIHEIDVLIAASLAQVEPEFEQQQNKVLAETFKRAGSVNVSGIKFPESLAYELAKMRAVSTLAGMARVMSQVTSTGTIVPGKGARTIGKAVEKAMGMRYSEAVDYMGKALELPADRVENVKQVFELSRFRATEPVKQAMADHATTLWERFRVEVPGGGEQDFLKWAKGEAPDLSQQQARIYVRMQSGIQYGAEQERSLEAVQALVGGWTYRSSADARVRPSHAALHLKTFPPGERQLLPPLGFNCRCGFVLAPAGAQVANESEIVALKAAVQIENPGWLKSPVQMELTGGPDVT